MKSAEVFAESSTEGTGYVWKWRAGNIVSGPFNFYYECLNDAWRNGYDVEMAQAHGDTAPDRRAGDTLK